MSPLSHALEARALLALTEAMIRAAQDAWDRGEDDVSYYLSDRVQECRARLRLVELVADRDRVLFAGMPVGVVG